MIETILIPFKFAKNELELNLVVNIEKRPGREHYKPLMKEEFPESLLKGNEKLLKKIERLYTIFGEPEKRDFKTTVKLSEQPMFSLHYARHIFRRYFETNPITIKYPSLLTEFLPYFRYEEIANPKFGCKTLWFL